MRFSKGVLGVVIVMTAIAATIIGGYVLNVGHETVTVDEATYLTDITGLFERSYEPEYLAYNPIENWTGYRAYDDVPLSGVKWTALPAGQTSNYPITSYENNPSTTITLPENVLSNYWPDVTEKVGIYWFATDDPISDSTPDGLRGISWPRGSGITPGPKYSALQPLSTVLAYMDVSGYIDITPDAAEGNILYSRISDWTKASWQVDRTHLSYIASLSTMRSITLLRVNVDGGTVSAYSGNDRLWTTSTQEAVCLIQTVKVANGELVSPNITSTRTVTYATTSNIYTEYMDISQGISTAQDTTPAFWSNGHKVQKMGIIVRTDAIPNAQSGGNVRFDIQLSSNDDYTIADYRRSITVTWDVDGMTISHWGDSIRFGRFEAVKLDIDYESGKLAISPIISWVSFADNTIQPVGGTLDLDTDDNGFRWARIETRTGGTAAHVSFGIVDTTVFMNTYDAVVKDEAIKVSDYWPTITDYQISIDSVGIYGGSLRIGNQYFDVTDGDVTINNDSFPLVGSKVDFKKDNGRWSVTVDDPRGSTHQVGTFYGDYIGFYEGNWLVTTGLYTVEPVTKTVAGWNGWSYIFDNNTAIVFYTGALVAGTAISTKFQAITLTDLAVVICAGTVGYVMMV